MFWTHLLYQAHVIWMFSPRLQIVFSVSYWCPLMNRSFTFDDVHCTVCLYGSVTWALFRRLLPAPRSSAHHKICIRHISCAPSLQPLHASRSQEVPLSPLPWPSVGAPRCAADGVTGFAPRSPGCSWRSPALLPR